MCLFCGTLDPDNRWVLLAELIPWQELEEAFAHQFSVNEGAPAKPGQLALLIALHQAAFRTYR